MQSTLLMIAEVLEVDYSKTVKRVHLNCKGIDLYHTAAMLSLRRIKSFVFASLALNSRLREACRAKTRLFISPETQYGAE